MNPTTISLGVFWAFIFTQAVFAAEKLQGILSPLPVTVSGTLDPVAVALDGQELLSREEAVDAVLLNGVSVAPQAEENRPFFLQSPADEIRLEARGATGVLFPVVDRKLPFARVEQVRDGQVDLIVSAGVSELRIDGKLVPLLGGKASWNPGATGGDAWERLHVVMIRGESQWERRIYNLQFEKKPDSSIEVPSVNRIELGMGNTPMNEGNGPRLAYLRRFSSGRAIGVYLKESSSGVQMDKYEGWALGLQATWPVFDRGSGLDRQIWLEVGAFLSVVHVRTSTQVSWNRFAGDTATTSSSSGSRGIQAGPVFRTEPFHFHLLGGELGVSAQVPFAAISTLSYPAHSGPRIGIDLGWNW